MHSPLVRQYCCLARVSHPSGPRILLSREEEFFKYDGKVKEVNSFIAFLNTQSRIASPSEKLGAHPGSGLEVLRM